VTAIDALLTDLKSRDIRLWVEDGRLRFSAPEGAMTAPLRQELKQRKEELLALLCVAPAAAEPGVLVGDPANAFKPFPLTRIQQAYWVGRGNPDSFELGGVSAHVYFELDGQGLDLVRLEWAWNTLVRRHGMLRAVVDADGQQRVLPDVPEYRVAVSDLVAASPAKIDAHVAAVRAELAPYVAPADRWPLFEIRATRLSGDRLRLHISFDGLVFDASSILLLSREAWQLYTTGRDTLAKLDLTFRDYVLAEGRQAAGPEYRRARAYWEARLDTLPPAPDLPLAQPMSALGVPHFRRRSFVLDASAWSALKDRARAAGLTPSTLLVSGFADVVALWAREPRFTINLSLFNRQPLHPQVDAVVGDFTTLTLLEVDTAGAPLFLDRAKAVQARLWQDMDHKAVGGVEVLGLMGRRRGWDGRAAMPVVFTSALSLDAVEGAGGAAEDLCPFGSIVYGITQTPQVLLDVLAVEHRGALHYAWDAVEDAFPPGLLDQMFDTYGTLVGRLAAEPGYIESLTRIQPELSFPAAPLRPVSESLLQDAVFRASVEKPEAVAILTSCKYLSFGEVACRSLGLANSLLHHGIRPAEPVAVLMDKGWQQVVAVLGILAAGGAYVPIETAWPASRRDQILRKTNARIVVVAAGHAAGLALPEGRIAIEIPEDAPAEMPKLPAIQTRPDDLAYVIFTSGSTGEPKGVMISHRAAVNTVDDINERWSVGPQDRVLALSALGFDLSVYDIFGVLGAGGAVVIPDAGHDRDPAHWHELMQKHGVTLWNSVPALMAMLTEFLSAEARATDVPLRLAMLSGDWIPVALPDEIRREFPDCAVVSLGGATEAAIWSIFHPVDTVEPGWTSIPYGRPLANQDVRVLDHDFATRPPWAIGELFIAGQGVAQGYWGDTELTAQRFVAHPQTGERLYRTGDFGRFRPDGVIEFLGREDRQVKIGGFRIELGEIESTLRQLPGIADAAVEAVGPDRANRRLVAYLVRAETDAIAPQPAVSDDLRYKMSHPGVRTDLGERPSIALPQSADDNRLSNFLKRQSFREFTDTKIQLADFAKLLHAICSRPMAGAPVPKRRYPSGGGLYPVQVYLSVKPDRIEGVAGGLYYLDPDGGALRQLSDKQAADTIHGDYNRGFAGAAAFDVFLVGNPDVVAASYPGLARDFCLIEAGAISQLLHERAPDFGMGLCGIGSVAFDALREALGLDAGHLLMHALIGGPIAPEQLTRWGSVIPNQPGLTDAAVLDHAARHLPAYMVPRQIVWLDQLPLSANGKIDRKALPQISDSAPSPVTKSAISAESGRAGSYAAFDDIVARCVEQVLGYQPVDRTRNLFDLGADSLKIIQIRNRIVASTNRPVGVLDFFRHPTVMLMAEKLQSIGDQRQ
jgi:amino acid adenylation domain-containing protein